LSGGYFVQDEKTDHPYIRVTDMESDKLNTLNIKYLPDGAFEKIKRYTISSDDVYISIAGTIGLVGKIPRSLSGANLTENAAKITELDRSLIDRDYLIYFLRSRQGQFQIRARVGGSTQPKLALNRIETIELPEKPVEIQRRIASVLSAYDDLIEKNEKRIEALEEMTLLIYNEWFVKLKFPGHEKAKMADSGTEYGMIPQEWNVNIIEGSFEILGGGTPSRSVPEYWNGKINWYTPTDLTGTNQMFTDRSSEQITEVGLKNSSAKFFPPYSIMMTSRATIGAISINTLPSTTNQGFIVCVPNEKVTLYYLYYWLKQRVSLFIDLGSGATFKEITKGNFKKIKILLPHPQVLNLFENKLKPIGDLILRLQRENRILSQTRNLLIPKLVTGKRELK